MNSEEQELKFGRRGLPISRRRSLVRDVCGCLRQQMLFWGCDARLAEGNLMIEYGMRKIARQAGVGEGSSRYRMLWMGGVIELHSFCAGWYGDTGGGVVFIRSRSRLFQADGEVVPGRYEEGTVTAATSDEMLRECRPLLQWVHDYESWVVGRMGLAYRERCWALSVPGVRPWLPPQEALRWIRQFLNDPDRTLRAREFLGTPARVTRQARSNFRSARP